MLPQGQDWPYWKHWEVRSTSSCGRVRAALGVPEGGRQHLQKES